MMIETRDIDIEQHMSVGAAVVLSFGGRDPFVPHYRTALRGWQRGSFILIDSPVQNGLPMTVRKGQPCLVRFMAGSRACGFDAEVLERSGPDQPHFRVTWPDCLEVIRVRKYDRIEIVVPCTVTEEDGTQTEGELRDLSAGGCKLYSVRVFPVSTSLTMSFVLPDGGRIENIQAEVCNTTASAKGAYHGCRFVDENDIANSEIDFFVSTALDRMRRPRQSGRRVLVIAQYDTDVEPVRQAFEQNDCAFIKATGLVDAFFQLRMMTPGLVVAEYDHPDLDGAEICRIVKNTHGLVNLPVIVFGDSNTPGDARKQAQNEGANAYIDSLDNPQVLVDKAIELINAAASPDDKTGNGEGPVEPRTGD